MGLTTVQSFKMKFLPSKGRESAKSPAKPETDPEKIMASYQTKQLPTPPISVHSDTDDTSHNNKRRASFDEKRERPISPSDQPKPLLRKLSLDFRRPSSQEADSTSWLPTKNFSLLPAAFHTTPGRPLEPPLERRDSGITIEKKDAEPGDFDLHPPAPKKSSQTVDGLAEKLFGEAHLRYILYTKKMRNNFAAYLKEHKPLLVLAFEQYLDNQKAEAAIAYANTIATMQKPLGGVPTPSAAASVSTQFQRHGQAAFDILLSEALPAYITHQLTREVSQYQMANVPNYQAQNTKPGFDGLSEVFCLSDPNLRDSPVIYASEEFFKLTQYGRDYAVGRNCRFMQGPKTSRESITRMKSALKDGREFNELVLNYRRDGSPFFNLLLVTPLRDDRGNLKYYLGAQIDVSKHVETMLKFMDSEKFAAFSAKHKRPTQFAHLKPLIQRGDGNGNTARTENAKVSQEKLKELFDLLSIGDIAALPRIPRKKKANSSPSSLSSSDSPSSSEKSQAKKTLRRKYVYEEEQKLSGPGSTQISEVTDKALRAPLSSLPNIYEHYLLVRPTETLPILFASPAMQKAAGDVQLLQSPLFSHFTASSNVLPGLKNAFVWGSPSTGQIYWPRAAETVNWEGNKTLASSISVPARSGRDTPDTISSTTMESRLTNGNVEMRWMSSTPLVGSDNKVGVWMVVIV